MSRLRAVGPFVLLAVLWGLSFPAISVGLAFLPPVLFAAFRYDLAAVILLAYAVALTDGWRPTGRSNLAAVAAGGVFLVGGNALLFVGQQTVPSGVAAIIQGLIPIATTLWALVLLGERVSARGAAGIALGFLGVGLVVRPDPANLLASDVVGKSLIVAQVALVALGSVLIERARPTLGRAALSGWSMGVGGLLLHAASVAAGEPFVLPSAPLAAGAVVYLAVFSTALAFVLFFTLLSRYGAVETSLVSYVAPLVTAAVGVLVLDERLTPFAVAGFAVVFAGFVLLKRRALADLYADWRPS